MIIRRVVGNSMLPTLKPGTIVVARKKPFSLGDIVMARIEGREVVKRVAQIKPKLVLRGDNVNSAVYEDVIESAIVGVLIWPKKKQS